MEKRRDFLFGGAPSASSDLPRADLRSPHSGAIRCRKISVQSRSALKRSHIV